MKPYWRSLMSLSLASVLVACSLGVPTPVSKPESPSLRGLIQPVSLEREAPVQQARAHAPKTVTFLDMVKKSPVQDAEPSEAPELDEALKALEQDEADFSIASHRHQRFFAASFKARIHPRSRYQVKIPASGKFNLVLEEAEQFKIVDKDATDGEARIQMPASTLKTFLYLKGKRRNRATLEIEDPLYQVKDTISTARRWGKWLRLGLRPLPVPTEWQSNDGNQLVFKMTTQDVKQFAMVWLRKNKTATFPPGLAEIGSEGGTVELPGVGRIEIPEGALDEKITVRLSQKPFHTRLVQHRSTGRIPNYTYYDYAAPIMKISPLGIQLNKDASIYLEHNLERVGTNDPSALDWKYFESEDSVKASLIVPNTTPTSLSEPIQLNKFVYITRVISEDLDPSSTGGDFVPDISEADEGFSVQSTSSNCPLAQNAYFFRTTDKEARFSSVYKARILKIIDAAQQHYCSRLSERPRFYYSFQDHDRIPITFSTKFLSPQVRRDDDNNQILLLPYNSKESSLIRRLAFNPVDIAHEVFHLFQENTLQDFPVEMNWLIEGGAVYAAESLATTVGLPKILPGHRNIYKLQDLRDSSIFRTELFFGINLENALRESYFPVLRGDGQDNFKKSGERNKNGINTEAQFVDVLNDYRSSVFLSALENALKSENSESFFYALTNKMLEKKELLFSESLSSVNLLKDTLSAFKYNKQQATLASLYHDYSEKLVSRENLFSTQFSDQDYKSFADVIVQMENSSDPYSLWRKGFGDSQTVLAKAQRALEPDYFPAAFEENSDNIKLEDNVLCLATKYYRINHLKDLGRITVELKRRSGGNTELKVRLLSMKIDEETGLSKVIRPKTVPPESETEPESDFRSTSTQGADYVYIAISNGKSSCEAPPIPYSYLKDDLDYQDFGNPLSYLYESTKVEISIERSIKVSNTRSGNFGTANTASPLPELLPHQMVIDIESSEGNKCDAQAPTQKQCIVLLEDRSHQPVQARIFNIIDLGKSPEGLTQQQIIVDVPNHALRGGYAYIVKKNGTESNVQLDATYACNMLPDGINFTTQANNVPDKLKPCLAKESST